MLYGLKYTYEIYGNFNIYAVLEITDNNLFINCYDRGKIKCKNITDKTDDICNIVKYISHWNMQCYNYPMEWIPNFDWTLSITTDDFNICCSGHDNYPPERDYFDKILRYIGIS